VTSVTGTVFLKDLGYRIAGGRAFVVRGDSGSLLGAGIGLLCAVRIVVRVVLLKAEIRSRVFGGVG
jgi:hypothetical protein